MTGKKRRASTVAAAGPCSVPAKVRVAQDANNKNSNQLELACQLPHVPSCRKFRCGWTFRLPGGAVGPSFQRRLPAASLLPRLAQGDCRRQARSNTMSLRRTTTPVKRWSAFRRCHDAMVFLDAADLRPLRIENGGGALGQ